MKHLEKNNNKRPVQTDSVWYCLVQYKGAWAHIQTVNINVSVFVIWDDVLCF